MANFLQTKIAAEKLRRFCSAEPDVFETEQDLHCVRAALADAYLELFPKDFYAPITEEFIESLNPPRFWEAGREYSWPKVGLRYAVELSGVGLIGEPGFYIDGRVEPIHLKHITTRGQARQLLAALGIAAQV